MSSGDKEVTIGYKYFLGMHMILCHGPVDYIKKIIVDGKDAWTGSQGAGSITVAAETLFGGEDREGGVSGVVDIQMGGETQLPNDYLVSKLGSMVPGYRGVVGAILRQCYVGLNPYIKRWAFRVQRIHVRQDGIAQWYDAKAAVGNDMNGAHIIRECLTDNNWGLGYQESDIDDVSFMAAADKMFTEGMGLSLLWDKSKNISDFIQDVLAHIQGSLYVSRITGKFTLKLTRADYVLGSLITLDEDSISKISDFKRGSIGELINSVTVVYWDASTGKDGSVTVQDIALVSQQQAVISTTKQYPGFTTGANAVRAASTELRVLSTPLASGTIYTNRKAASLNVGDCFILSWSRYGVSQLVCRVTNVELGSIESNMIKLSVVEDVFGQTAAIYAPPPASGWTDPNSAPAPCPYHCVIEAPYWELVQRMGETAARSLASTASFVVATGVRPSSDARNAKLYSNPGSGIFVDYGSVDFCPTAVLGSAISYTDTAWTVNSGIDLDNISLNSYAIIDNEIVSILAISGTALTVGRGCLDTVPNPHILGSRIYFSDAAFASDNVEYATGENSQIKLLPTTGKGVLAIGSANIQYTAFVGRQAKPYPPQNLRLNNLFYNPTVRGDTNLVIDWSHRDRLQQTVSLVPATTGAIGPEAGTTYSVQLFTEAGAYITGTTDLTGQTYTFTLAAIGANYGRLNVKLWAVRSTVASLYNHYFLFTRAGYGTGYGYAYGGI